MLSFTQFINEQVIRLDAENNQPAVIVYCDPPFEQLVRLLEKSEYQEFRWMMDTNEHFYFWDAANGTHLNISGRLYVEFQYSGTLKKTMATSMFMSGCRGQAYRAYLLKHAGN